MLFTLCTYYWFSIILINRVNYWTCFNNYYHVCLIYVFNEQCMKQWGKIFSSAFLLHYYLNFFPFVGVFLVCWVPFFTINIINAICLRYDGRNTNPMCHLDDILFSLFTWLGYINSFLNPVIYTIFNPEFRKAFKKILTERCP